jgi:hypothetical protein
VDRDRAASVAVPLLWRIRHRLAELLPRWLAVALRIRRLSPAGDYWPTSELAVPAIDTGGGYRAKHRRQDPGADPSEPYGSESSSVGNEHGWSGCTMTAGADAIAYQQPRGGLTPWGGDLRHRQSDLSGGTDLYDLRTAWAEYGETLTIKTGSGWGAVKTAHGEGRAIVIQGTGNVPGSETFDGGHACAIAPETHSDGRWLFGDPLASDWQWVKPSDIETWAERMSSGVYYAVGEKPPATPPPEPVPTPPAPADRYAEGRRDGEAHGELVGAAQYADTVFRSWAPMLPLDPGSLPAGGRWDVSTWAGATTPTPPADGDPWAAWPLPIEALWRASSPASWSDVAVWAGGVWRA